MAEATVDQKKIPMIELVWPLLVENLLRTSLMSVDTLMLSHYSGKAVAAMSLVSQMTFFILLIYMMVSVGASILIAQNLGAGRHQDAEASGVGSIIMMLGLSVVLSLAVLVFIHPVVTLFGVEPDVARYAEQFMKVFGGLSVFMALNIAQASIVRVWGYTRAPMWVNTGCLVLTVVGNALCLFGLLGFPVLGMVGVAGSTVLSQLIACVAFHWFIKHKTGIRLPLKQANRVPRTLYRSMLRIGVPTVGENLSYNLSQIAILGMVARMGTAALAGYGIAISILRYVFMPGVSIGSATQLKVGYLVGAGHHEEASRRVYRYFGTGFLISFALVTTVALARFPILSLFTKDAGLLALTGTLLLVAIIHEPGRNFNTIIIPALKGAGDVLFPVNIGVVSMWGIGVAGSWLLGLHLGLGLVGVWLAMAADEWVRGLIMLARWRSGAWKARSFVKPGHTSMDEPSPTATPVVSPALLPVAEE